MAGYEGMVSGIVLPISSFSLFSGTPIPWVKVPFSEATELRFGNGLIDSVALFACVKLSFLFIWHED